MTPTLSHNLLRQLSTRIESAMGLHFPSDRLHDLERKIRQAARELAFLDVEGFVQWLLTSPMAGDQIRLLAGYLTIGETYFYREPRAWEILRYEILPTVIADRADTNRRVRFWSTACSTGEEPYTLAMALADAGLTTQQGWQSQILATDVNPNAIRRAQAGLYGSWSFRATPPDARTRYFTPTGKDQFTINSDIQKMVTFAEANLVNPDPIPNSGLMDVIFCRNVLFYFAPERVKYVLERLYDSLVDGGWLIVSPVETTYLTELPFVPVMFGGTTVYRKDIAHPHIPAPWPLAMLPAPPPVSVSSPTPVLPTSVAALPPPPLSRTEIYSPAVMAIDPVPTPASDRIPAPQEHPLTLPPYEQAHACYAQGQYEQVVALLLPLCQATNGARRSTKPDTQVLTLLARAYANQGHLVEAQGWCEHALNRDRLNPSLHYLLATVLLEQERIPDATRSLQKAIYANPNFVLAHFALGNILSQQKQHDDANRYLQSALAILQQTPSEQIVPESEGLTAGRLAALVSSMLRR